MDLSNLKIGVLGGGISAEREISLLSAKAVCDSLSRKGVEPIYFDVVSSSSEDIKNFIESCGINFVFIALHGEFGEDGGVQKLLEDLNICYTGSGPEASLLAMDKAAAKKVFKAKGIRTPNFLVYLKGGDISVSFKYPLVVKPCSLGSSLGLSIVRDKNSLEEALRLASLQQDKIILEEYIDGREFSVGILDDRPLAVVEIMAENNCFDFENKYSKGHAEFVSPAELVGETYKIVQNIALAAHKSLGCRHFSRVDIRLDKNNLFYVLEVNSIPGLTSHSLLPLSAKSCGFNFDKLILEIINLTLNEKKKTQKV